MGFRLRELGLRIWHGDAEDGQGLVEYALILGLVAVLCVGALGVLQVSVDENIRSVAAGL